MSKKEPDFSEILAQIEESEEAAGMEESEAICDYKVTDSNVTEFILERGAQLVDDGLEAVTKLKGRITAAQDCDEIAALSQLIKATNSALGTLTSIAIQNKKDKTSKELGNNQPKQLKTVNNTLIIGTREDAMRELLKAKEQNAMLEVSPPPYDRNNE